MLNRRSRMILRYGKQVPNAVIKFVTSIKFHPVLHYSRTLIIQTPSESCLDY